VLALGLEPGDEVIVPAYTFPATANVVALSGLKPVLVDVDPVTMNIDPADAARRVTPRTRAVLAVHLFGRPTRIEELPDLRAEFERVGGGAILTNSPYDLAAAALCLEEAGAVVTDAYGAPLASRPLLGSGADFQISCITASNRDLHAKICTAIEAGIERLASASG